MGVRRGLLLLAGAACLQGSAGDAVAQSEGGRKAVSLAVVLDGEVLGEALVRGDTVDNVRIPADALIDILTPVIGADTAVLKRLAQSVDGDGNISVPVLRSAGLWVKVDGQRLVLSRTAPKNAQTRQLEPQAISYAKPAGPAGVALPVLVNGLHLGEVLVRFDRAGNPLLPKAALIDILSPVFGHEVTASAQLEAMDEDDGHVTAAKLQRAGFHVRIDRKALELKRVPLPAMTADAGPVPSPAIPRRGRALNVVVPLKEGGALLGEVPVEIDADQNVRLPKAALLDILAPFLEEDDAALGRLSAVRETNGQVSIEDLKAAGFGIVFDRKILEVTRKPPVQAEAKGPRLNPTGRTVTLNVPLKDGEVELGDIIVYIEKDDTIRLPKAALAQRLAGVLNKTEMARLEAMPGAEGRVSLAELGAANLRLKYDPNQQELVFQASVDQRVANDLNLGARRGQAVAGVSKPATVSGYLNIIGGADYLWRTPNAASFNVDLQSVVRAGNLVLENTGSYAGDIDPNFCPANAQCLYTHQAGMKRQSSRLIYDQPESQIRLQVGDVVMAGTAIQHTNEVLGVSLDKTSRIFAPGESIRPSGSGSFTLEKAADVEVQVNGVTIQRLRLRPGAYNVRDLPLATGSNDVLLVITDETGARRSLPFTMFSADTMLAAGKSEWTVNGGLASFIRDGERLYESEHYLASAFYRYGYSDALTLETQAKGDQFAQMAGVGLITATKLGTFGLQGAVGNSAAGTGLAVNANWDLVNFSGPLGSALGSKESLRFAAEYRDPQFRLPGEYMSNASGVIYAQYPYWLRLTGAYTLPLGRLMTATLAGRYQWSDDKLLTTVPNAVGGARYGADLTLSAPILSTVSGSVTAGYSNETFVRPLTGAGANEAPEVRIMLTVNIRPDEKTRIASTYDSLNQLTNVAGHVGTSNGLDRWEADVNVQQSAMEQSANATGSIGYVGNRGEIRVSQAAGFASPSLSQFQPVPEDQRTSFRVGSSLAFADGHVAVGQPIRGGAFAIVYPHESIADKEVSVGPATDVRARANGLGPALVTDLPAYIGSNLPLDVSGLPVGYSLGTGSFDVVPPYRGGYALEVGSANSVSAFGTLMTGDFTPVALASGVAFPADDPEKQVVIFTNKAGRFGAEGLAPGRWVIEMKLESGPLRYELNVPEKTDGLLRAGILLPTAGG